MAEQKLIPVKEFCVHHNISSEFIIELYRYEMIDLVQVKRTRYIDEKNLSEIERMIRLHRDLDINMEGIQAILQLLSALDKKDLELKRLRNELEFYVSHD